MDHQLSLFELYFIWPTVFGFRLRRFFWVLSFGKQPVVAGKQSVFFHEGFGKFLLRNLTQHFSYRAFLGGCVLLIQKFAENKSLHLPKLTWIITQNSQYVKGDTFQNHHFNVFFGIFIKSFGGTYPWWWQIFWSINHWREAGWHFWYWYWLKVLESLWLSKNNYLIIRWYSSNNDGSMKGGHLQEDSFLYTRGKWFPFSLLWGRGTTQWQHCFQQHIFSTHMLI